MHYDTTHLTQLMYPQLCTGLRQKPENKYNHTLDIQPLVRSVRESLVSNLAKCHITEYIATVLSTVLNSHDPPTF